MIHDVVIDEKRYTGENVSRDRFKIIGAYANHIDAYMAVKKQLVFETVIDSNVIKTVFRGEENRC